MQTDNNHTDTIHKVLDCEIVHGKFPDDPGAFESLSLGRGGFTATRFVYDDPKNTPFTTVAVHHVTDVTIKPNAGSGYKTLEITAQTPNGEYVQINLFYDR